MSLTLSPFVVVYHIQAYSVILAGVLVQVSTKANAVIFVCFVSYLYASQVLSTKCCT